MTIQKETHAPTTLTPYNFGHHYGLRLWCLALLLLLLPATGQLPNAVPPPPPSIPDPFSKLRFDRNMAIIMVILVVAFFILGFLSVYTRQCAERRTRGRLDLTLPMGMNGRRSRGLDAEIIDSFPTFVYSTVKGVKMGRSTLECAVCLNEFEDDETLRLIPKCSHVFHPDCIDMWLASHSTCPVCRANLIPRPGETSFVAIQIPSSGVFSQEPDPGSDGDGNRVAEESPNGNGNRRVGVGSRGIFARSHSTGHSLEGENWERLALRLGEEARKELVTFRSEGRSWRTRSVGVSVSSFLSRNMDNVGQRCSHPLCDVPVTRIG